MRKALAALAALLVAAALTVTLPASSDPVQAHAQLSATFDQYDGGVVGFDSVDSIAGATFDPATDTLTLDEGGVWVIVAAPQVGSIEHPGAVGSANVWITTDGTPVPNSNVSWAEKGSGVGDVIVSQGVGVFPAGTEVTVMWSTTGPVLEAIEPAGEPLVPSVIFSAFRIG